MHNNSTGDADLPQRSAKISQIIHKNITTFTTFAVLVTGSLLFAQTAQAADTSVQTWWPAQNARVSGVQPFKAVVPGMDVSTYQMYWQVDGGQLNQMYDSMVDYPHKETMVDVSSWRWQSSGVYTVTFVARDSSGATLAQQAVSIVAHDATTASPTPVTAILTSTPVIASPVAPSNSAPGVVTAARSGTVALYVNPDSRAAVQASQWRQSRPMDAALMDVLAQQPTATWLGGWNADVQSDVTSVVTKAAQRGEAPVFVAYNIPGRDCGGYSAGGVAPDQYRTWIQAVAAGIGQRQAVVILEPDALAGITCLSADAAAERTALLQHAIATLKANSGTRVYVDAGHAGWVDAATMAARLSQVGVNTADGFALNVSNFGRSEDQTAYGTQVSQALGGQTHFVIDTTRNGVGPAPDNAWCNPQGRAIGVLPTLTPGGASLLDGYLWVKTPGESDGTCNGGPNAGEWWPDYALDLVKNSPYVKR